ncbi:MAG: DNA polymerase III subunit beta [Gemmatimonadaceae bacterium]|jgi:DNA polymerase-3 subunit beta|nr:DNA polymerase III subunit beta [Gemmatimonadaceae bacterium]
MRFTISREKLLEGLNTVQAAVPARSTLPVLSNLLVETTERGVKLSATDLDIAISTEVSADVESQGAITIPARKLSEIARELPPSPVKIASSGEQRISLECGRSKFKLLGLAKDEFPAFPVVRFGESWRIKSSELQKLIQHTAFAASTEESRPILNGVLWELKSDRMRMVATNGHRLAKMELPLGDGAPANPSDLIVPPKALDQVRRLFPAEEELEIARGDNHLGFRSPITSVFTRLIEGPYPNYEQVIPKDNDRICIADRQALTGALKRMSIVASDQTHRIRLALNAGMCKLSATTPDLGDASDEIQVSYTGDQLEIGFNASYLLEILRQLPTDSVKLSFKAPEKATTIEPDGWDDPAQYLCLVMPLRLLD